MAAETGVKQHRKTTVILFAFVGRKFVQLKLRLEVGQYCVGHGTTKRGFCCFLFLFLFGCLLFVFVVVVVCGFFLKHLNNKSKTRGNIGSLPNKNCHLKNRDIDKIETFNAFFVFVFKTDNGLWGLRCPELEDCDYSNDQLPVNM